MPEQVGHFQDRIIFQSSVDTVVTPGGISRTWSNVASTPTVWAQAMAGVGREFRNANQIEGERIYTFTIHRRTDITRLMRIKFDPLSPMNPASASALNFNIHDIRHDGDRFWTRILASEVK